MSQYSMSERNSIELSAPRIGAAGAAWASATTIRSGMSNDLRDNSIDTDEVEAGEPITISEQLQEVSIAKHALMVEHLYFACRQKGWFDANDDSGCVSLRVSSGLVVVYPPDAQPEFEQAIIGLNVEVAVKVTSKMVRSVFDLLQPNASDLAMVDGTKLQVLDNVSRLPRARKHQWGALTREEKALIVWDDSVDTILAAVEGIDKKILQLVWSGIPKEALQEDLEAAEGERRPYMFITPIVSTLSMMTVIILFANGVRTLLMECWIDHKWTRLALLATAPFEALVLQFVPMALFGSAMGMLGPVWHIKQNTVYYSGAAPKKRLSGEVLPHITVQVPIYKESLKGVIDPTIQSLKKAISTYELQGGTANIFVNDDGMQLVSAEEVAIRKQYYENHSIGWVARPPHGKNGFIRQGRFKKASNMNYALNITNQVECHIQKSRPTSGWSPEEEAELYDEALKSILEEDDRTWAGGNIRVGEFILLVDSDTRVPEDCFLDAASELTQSPQVAIIQHSSDVMLTVHNYWEHGIAWFTRMVYSAIRFSCASGDVAAFVGHNAFLRWSAVQEVAFEEDGILKYWSESHVSEDFDMSLRLQMAGYITRYATYHGSGFQEGVSLTVYDEVTRWQKYAFGCSELVFHPLRYWLWRGPFTPIIKSFFFSNMKLYAKFNIIGYIGSYYAIASAVPITILNYVLWGYWSYLVDHFYVTSFEVLVVTILVFPVFGNIALSILRYRLAERTMFEAFVENCQWIPFFMVFFSGLSFHVSGALISHIIGYNMQWSATAKELENSNFFQEMPKVLKGYKLMYIFFILLTVMLPVVAYVPPPEWQINDISVILPVAIMCAGHLLLPLALNPFLMYFSY